MNILIFFHCQSHRPSLGARPLPPDRPGLSWLRPRLSREAGRALESPGFPPFLPVRWADGSVASQGGHVQAGPRAWSGAAPPPACPLPLSDHVGLFMPGVYQTSPRGLRPGPGEESAPSWTPPWTPSPAAQAWAPSRSLLQLPFLFNSSHCIVRTQWTPPGQESRLYVTPAPAILSSVTWNERALFYGVSRLPSLVIYGATATCQMPASRLPDVAGGRW